ncbi:XRE family transcriptional regulator [Thermomonas paludicola]|uniref:XRE family transcriptional regulator n=1 Tax=Thermomonas paludicola TaxID=2884874 RepID=UPI002114554A|nr:XRE family transcriptional regulator [Thermomonas paludicola]
MNPGETGTTHITYGSIFDDREVFEAGDGAELKAQSTLLTGLQTWLAQSGLSVAAAAKQLDATPTQIKFIRRGGIHALELALLLRMAARAGLKPEVRLGLLK